MTISRYAQISIGLDRSEIQPSFSFSVWADIRLFLPTFIFRTVIHTDYITLVDYIMHWISGTICIQSPGLFHHTASGNEISRRINYENWRYFRKKILLCGLVYFENNPVLSLFGTVLVSGIKPWTHQDRFVAPSCVYFERAPTVPVVMSSDYFCFISRFTPPFTAFRVNQNRMDDKLAEILTFLSIFVSRMIRTAWYFSGNPVGNQDKRMSGQNKHRHETVELVEQLLFGYMESN